LTATTHVNECPGHPWILPPNTHPAHLSDIHDVSCPQTSHVQSMLCPYTPKTSIANVLACLTSGTFNICMMSQGFMDVCTRPRTSCHTRAQDISDVRMCQTLPGHPPGHHPFLRVIARKTCAFQKINDAYNQNYSRGIQVLGSRITPPIRQPRERSFPPLSFTHSVGLPMHARGVVHRRHQAI